MMFELGCKTDNDVDMVEQSYKYNIDTENLKVRNTDLQTEYKTEETNYIEIKIIFRMKIYQPYKRNEPLFKLMEYSRCERNWRISIKIPFGDDIFAEAQTIVNNDLGEKSLKKSLIEQIEQEKNKQQKSIPNKYRNHEIERQYKKIMDN